MFCIPPVDPLLQLGRGPHASETRRDCDPNFDELGVVVLAVGVCEAAEDLVFDEGEIEVEDVEGEGAHLVFHDFPTQLHGEYVVHLPADMRQVVCRHRYEVQSLFLGPEFPQERLIGGPWVTQCCGHDLDSNDVPKSYLGNGVVCCTRAEASHEAVWDRVVEDPLGRLRLTWLTRWRRALFFRSGCVPVVTGRRGIARTCKHVVVVRHGDEGVKYGACVSR